mgnify:CR=1 FL=1
MVKDPHIRERMNRTKEIIEQLDTDECSLRVTLARSDFQLLLGTDQQSFTQERTFY